MTIINNTWKFIFVHIPKTAGTSVAYALEPLCTWRDLQLGGTPFGETCHRAFTKQYKLSKHSIAAELRNSLGHASWSSYASFSVIRDPVSRTISTYQYLSHHKDHYRFMQDLPTLSDFLRSDSWQGPGPDRMFLPQVTWLYSVGKDRQLLVDHLIRMEDLENQLTTFLMDAGIPTAKVKKLKIARKNASPPLPKAIPLHEDLELIEKRYSKDYEKLAYTKPSEMSDPE